MLMCASLILHSVHSDEVTRTLKDVSVQICCFYVLLMDIVVPPCSAKGNGGAAHS